MGSVMKVICIWVYFVCFISVYLLLCWMLFLFVYIFPFISRYSLFEGSWKFVLGSFLWTHSVFLFQHIDSFGIVCTGRNVHAELGLGTEYCIYTWRSQDHAPLWSRFKGKLHATVCHPSFGSRVWSVCSDDDIRNDIRFWFKSRPCHEHRCSSMCLAQVKGGMGLFQVIM